jgi:CRISPR type IV-associated protein Csf3
MAKAFTPFRVTWELSQPVCLSERPLHLDALLAFSRVQEALRLGVPAKDALDAQENLPLESAEIGPSKVWKASALLFRFRSLPFLIQMTRRTSVEDVAFASKTVVKTVRRFHTQGSGEFKDFEFRATLQWVDKVEAYGVGDMTVVESLLGEVPALGRVIRNGWGTIRSMQLEPFPEAAEKWRYRTLPANFEPTEYHFRGRATVRPPYFKRQNWEPVWDFAGIY